MTYTIEVHTPQDGWQLYDSSDSRDIAIQKCHRAVPVFGTGNVRLHTIAR